MILKDILPLLADTNETIPQVVLYFYNNNLGLFNVLYLDGGFNEIKSRLSNDWGDHELIRVYFNVQDSKAKQGAIGFEIYHAWN